MGIALKVEAFGGMVPAVDDRLLPQHAAALAQNTYLYSGKLQGTYTPTLLHTLSNPSALKVFLIPTNFTDSAHLSNASWLEFSDANTDVLKSVVVGDQYNRYYWASSSQQPMYNTLARIIAGNPGFLLGIPQPPSPPGVTVAGGSIPTEARAYAYTWQSTLGEEGPPSTPTVVTGNANGTWNITLTAAAANDTNGTNRVLGTTNIYRTVTGSNGIATYFLCASIPIATLTFADTASDATISGNAQLQSTTWTAPPTDLAGWVSMPNGMIAGWRANEVWFCEPYRPHAWPAAYAFAVEYPIVGLGVVGQTLIICTDGNPYWAFGVHPSMVSSSKIGTVEPCLARGSILSAPEGVYYASPNGLVLANQGVALVITRKLMTKDKWLNLVNVPTLRAARLGTAYYAWGSGSANVFEVTAFEPTAFDQQDLGGSRVGCLIDMADERVAVSTLSNVDPAYNTMNDTWTGEVFIIRDGGVYWLNIANSSPTPDPYIWRSKVFQAPNKRNLEAMKVYFEVLSSLPPLNATANTSLVQTLTSGQYGLVRIYADGKLVWTRELRVSGELMRLPSGFKADFYQLEINAYVNVFNVQIAESAKELARV